MKRLLYISLATILLFSCKKYEEGPFLTFRTVKKRLYRSWNFESVLINGVDRTSDYKNIVGYFDRWDIGQQKIGISVETSNTIKLVSLSRPDYFSSSFSIGDKKETITLIQGENIPTNDSLVPFSFGPIGCSHIGFCDKRTTLKILKLTIKKLKMSTQYNGDEYVFELIDN